MTQLTRIKIKAAPPTRTPPRTKVLLVRQPSARPAQRIEHREKTPTRLAIGVIVAIGAVAAIWLLGFLGWRLGFAPILRVRDLLAEPSGGLATGAIMLINVPRVILQSGMNQTPGFMLAFLLIAIPGACLAAVKTYPPGGPRVPSIVFLFACIGAAASALNGIALIWWTVSSVRNAMLRELPIFAADAEAWLGDLQTVSGLDVLATVCAACWVVLVMRLPVPLWLKALATTFAMFTLVVVAVAMSKSNVTVAQLQATRSVFWADDGGVDAGLLFGSTREHFAVLRLQRGIGADGTPNHAIVIELIDQPNILRVIETNSIVDFLTDAARTERP